MATTIEDIVQRAYDSIFSHPTKICLYIENYSIGHEKEIIKRFKNKFSKNCKFEEIDYSSSKKHKCMQEFQLYNYLFNSQKKNKKLFFIILDPFSQLDGQYKDTKIIGEFKGSDIVYSIDVGKCLGY